MILLAVQASLSLPRLLPQNISRFYTVVKGSILLQVALNSFIYPFHLKACHAEIVELSTSCANRSFMTSRTCSCLICSSSRGCASHSQDQHKLCCAAQVKRRARESRQIGQALSIKWMFHSIL